MTPDEARKLCEQTHEDVYCDVTDEKTGELQTWVAQYYPEVDSVFIRPLDWNLEFDLGTGEICINIGYKQ